jgi:hypothetical protein
MGGAVVEGVGAEGGEGLGRPEAGSKDARCLARLEGLGLVVRGEDGAFRLSPAGYGRLGKRS